MLYLLYKIYIMRIFYYWIKNLDVHFFDGKETNQKKPPAHALFTLSKDKKYVDNVLNSQDSNSRTKNVAIFLSLPIALWLP